MDQKRSGIITSNRKPMTLVGPALQPGDIAPDFRVLKANLAPVTLADSARQMQPDQRHPLD